MPRLPPDLPPTPPSKRSQKAAHKKPLPDLPPLTVPELPPHPFKAPPAKRVSERVDFSSLAADDPIAKRAAEDEYYAMLMEVSRRQCESLKLWEPLDEQEKFHASKCRYRLVRGGNRGGKTLCGAAEVARAVTRQDPHGKYPPTGDIFIVGRDLKHLGTTIFTKLFGSRDGQPFWMIRDRKTGLWRAYRPWDAEDRSRHHERKSAPPLIPQRFYGKRDITWHSRGLDEPERAKLNTGWTIWFFSGKAPPPQGKDVNLVWLDEEIERRDWLPEMNFRIIDRGGRLIWTFTPQAGTEQAYNLSQQAQSDALLTPEHRGVEEFCINMGTNPHIGEKEKRDAEAATVSEEDYQVRVKGEFAMAGQIVWREFNLTTHGIEFDRGIPAGWTKYAIIDPGHQICAVLFAAVPNPDDVKPSEYDLVLYDELYIPGCSAAILANQFAEKTVGQRFHAFIIDSCGSRPSDAGTGTSIYEQYETAFRQKGIRSEASGSGFWWGSSDVSGGVERVRGFLRPAPTTGKPRLRILCRRDDRGLLKCALPNFEWEINRYRYKRDPMTRMVTDMPEDRGRVHLMSTARYLCMANPKYVRPKDPPVNDRLLRDFFAGQKKPQRGVPRVTVFGPAHSGGVA